MACRALVFGPGEEPKGPASDPAEEGFSLLNRRPAEPAPPDARSRAAASPGGVAAGRGRFVA